MDSSILEGQTYIHKQDPEREIKLRWVEEGEVGYSHIGKYPYAGLHGVMSIEDLEKDFKKKGNVLKLETLEEDVYSAALNMIADDAMDGNTNAQGILSDIWDGESWESIKKKLEVEGSAWYAEGSVWYVWWMDGVRELMRREQQIGEGKEAQFEWPKEIDFTFHEGSPLHYKKDTVEYQLLDMMAEEDWQEYLDDMARAGITVEYDNVRDAYTVSVGGYKESKKKADVEFDKKIESGEVWEEYYPPSDSMEYFDGKTYYNWAGQRLRAPKEYDTQSEGYTPFGDE